MTTIVVSDVIANKYRNGGAVWSRLSWALGFKKLGFEVYFLEQINPESCIDAAGAVTAFEDCLNLAYFKQITEQFGLGGAAALIYNQGEQTYGLSYAELLDLAEAADLLVNITGHLSLEPLLRRLRRKVYVDVDPGFTQFWYASGSAGSRLGGHDFYFTIGENIGTPGCPIPTGDITWHRTRQPVVLEYWPVSEISPSPLYERGARPVLSGVKGGDFQRFTTVASWRGPYGPIQHGGKTFGLKVHEFRKFIELPQQSEQRFEIALNIHPADGKDLDLLQRHGWRIVDPKTVAPDPMAFRCYVQTSGAEFSVAQGLYVETGSGWFSDRTVRYLASGKPALVQDTGFSRNYPVGEGLVAFRTLQEASRGVAEIVSDYDRHCRAARALAETYFDSDKVLGRLVEEVAIAP